MTRFSHGQQTVLRFREIAKYYGSLPALQNVSFEIAEREFVALHGANGAGKSTLFQVATGLLAPDHGSVEVFGKSYRTSAREILRKVGVVFQVRSIDLDMTVRSNLAFHGGLFGLWGRKLRLRIEGVTDLLDLTGYLASPVRSLSGGNQRRVEIARSLLHEPSLLLMDEPSAGLDAMSRHALIKHMHWIRDQCGTSILWATHLADELGHADRIIDLVEGRC